MAPIKRKSIHKGKGLPLNKKQKTTARENEAEGSLSKTGAIPIDQLEWQEVALPDHLEDVEGFFGLEEIENVEIVRDAKNGNIVYKVRRIQSSSDPMSLTVLAFYGVIGCKAPE